MFGAEVQLRALAQQSGWSEDDFLLTIVTRISGSRPADTIWDPPAAPAGRP